MGQSVVCLVGLGQRPVVVTGHHRVKDWIDLVDPVEVGLHNLSTRHLPPTNPFTQIDGGLVRFEPSAGTGVPTSLLSLGLRHRQKGSHRIDDE